MTSSSAVGIAVVVMCLAAACTWYNATDRVCLDSPQIEAMVLPGGSYQWAPGLGAATQIPSGDTLIAYAHRQGDAVASAGAQLNSVLVNSENGAISKSCGGNNADLDPEGRAAVSGTSLPVELAPSFPLDAPVGAFAYHLSTPLEPGETRGLWEEVRFSFLGPEGCPARTESGDTFFEIERASDERVLAQPRVSHLREGRYVVTWLSKAEESLVFDDRVRARIVQNSWPRYGTNYGSMEGQAIDLDLPDRWIATAEPLTIDTPGANEKRLAIVWYAIFGDGGRVKLRLFNEQLEPTNDLVELGNDRDSGDGVRNKAIAITFDAARHDIIAVWTEERHGIGTLIGRRVNVWPEPVLGPQFEIASPDSGPARDPSVTIGPDGNTYIVWHTNNNVWGSIRSQDGERRFTTFACGPEPFAFGKEKDAVPFYPILSIGKGRLSVVLSQSKGNGNEKTMSVSRASVPTKQAFPSHSFLN